LLEGALDFRKAGPQVLASAGSATRRPAVPSGVFVSPAGRPAAVETEALGQCPLS